ncbi:MAG: hypothetical protein ACOC59_02925 [Bacteroidota bacterium]
MNRFTLIFGLILVALIILHLVFTLDYGNLYTTENKAGATGIIVGILGLIALWLSNRAYKGETDVT